MVAAISASGYAAQWRGKAIGEVFCLRDDLVAPPPAAVMGMRFIRLTAGDAFNDGALAGESISGSAPLVVATAVIDYPESPLNGQAVNLLNTEGRYIKPGATAGAVANDQMQRITGETGSYGYQRAFYSPVRSSGALSPIDDEYFSTVQGSGSAGGMTSSSTFRLDSADSPGARTGDRTDVKHQQATYYMRIA